MVDSCGPLIFDISSDEEEEDHLTDCDWISELFPDDDVFLEREEEDDDDDDDVVVISDNNNNINKKKINNNKKVDNYEDEDDDDECVVLEGDPDKHVEVERCGGGGGGDSDDLVIVCHKGKIACRDYPHARHLCAKFLFASTPHEQHCDQCHCYVCDSLAPCIYWGNGGSNTDHCHSTDQDPVWKAQRQNLKQGNKALLLPLQPPDVILSLPPLPQTIPVPTSTPVQNQIPRLSNSSISHLTHQRRTHPNKFNPCLVSQQLLSSCNSNYNNTNQIIGRPTPTNLGAQYLSRPRLFKKTGSNLVGPPNAHPGYGTNDNKFGSRYPRNPHPLPNLSKRRNSTYQQKTPFAGSQPQPYYGGTSMGSVPLSQPRFNGNNNVVNSISSPLSQPQFNGNNSGVNSISSPRSQPQFNGNSGVNSISSPRFQPQFNGNSGVNSISSPRSQPQFNGNNSGVNSISSPLSQPQFNGNNSGVNSISSPRSQPQLNGNNSGVNSISSPLSQPQFNGNNSGVNSISSPRSQPQFNGNNSAVNYSGVNSISSPLSQPQFNGNNSGVNLISSPLSQPQFNGLNSAVNYSGVNSISSPLSQPQFNGNNCDVNSNSSQPQAYRNRFANSLASQQSALQTSMGSTALNPMAPPYHPLESYPQPNIGMNNYENSLPCQSQTLSQPSTSNSSFINPIYTQSQTYSEPNYEQQVNETVSATNNNSTVVGPRDQYNPIDSFSSEGPALFQPGVPEYDTSIFTENTNNQYSHFCEVDPWMGGYVGTDGFDLGPIEAATVDTGGLFEYD